MKIAQLKLSPLFSIKRSAISMAARNLALVLSSRNPLWPLRELIKPHAATRPEFLQPTGEKLVNSFLYQDFPYLPFHLS